MWLKGAFHQNKHQFKQRFKQRFKECTCVIVCASVTTKQLDTARHVISWKFPGNFRETACRPTTARATGETPLLTVLLRLL